MLCTYLTWLSLGLFWPVQAIFPGVTEIGIGYDILQGNPNGGEFYAPNIDPGFKINMNILQITELTEGKYQELKITNHSNCQSVTNTHIFYDSQTYRNELLSDITFKATTSHRLEDLAFGKSNLFVKMNDTMVAGDTVYIDIKTVCDTGLITYKDYMAEIDRYALTREFAGSVCLLPTEYNSVRYRDFLDTWGTHLVMEIHTGYKVIERYHTSKRDLFEKVMLLLGSLNIYQMAKIFGLNFNIVKYVAYVLKEPSVKKETFLIKETIDTIKYLEFNTDLFHTGNVASNFPRNHYDTIKLGSALDNIPIKLKLAPITEVLKDKYWRVEYNDVPVCIDGFRVQNLPTLRSNLETAFRELKQENRLLECKASKLMIPLQWPSGTYGLPMTRNGCPEGGVSWSFGEVKQDTEDDSNSNAWSDNAANLLNVALDVSHITTKFCMKTNDNVHNYGLVWPAGEYCILKKGSCPQGFESGSVKWDDEDSGNLNNHSGVLPDGSFSKDTDIHFCCRQDGSAAVSISLPVERNFALYRKGNICQKVKDMQDELVHIWFDTENSNPSNALWADYPNIEQIYPGLKVFYCVYNKQFITYNPIG